MPDFSQKSDAGGLVLVDDIRAGAVGFVLFDDEGALATGRDAEVLDDISWTIYRARPTLIGKIPTEEIFQRITEAAAARDRKLPA